MKRKLRAGNEVRERILSKTGGICAYCGTQINGNLHMDHMIPMSKGGADTEDNLAPACRKCNLQKKAMYPLEFMEWRREREH